MFQWFHLGVCILAVDPNGIDKQDGLAPQIVHIYSQEYEQKQEERQRWQQAIQSAHFNNIPSGTGFKMTAMAQLAQCGGTKRREKHHWQFLKDTVLKDSSNDRVRRPHRRSF